MAAPNHGQGTRPEAESSPGMFQVISLGGRGADDQQTWEYKRRKPHRKSRGGCQGCKVRRVKCDQEMPACLRCKRNQRVCVYEGGGSGAGEGSSASAKDDGSGRDSGSKTQAGAAQNQKQQQKLPARSRQLTPVVRVKREYEDDATSSASSSSNQSADADADAHGPSPLVRYASRQQQQQQQQQQRVPRSLRANPLQTQLLEYGTPSNQLMHHFDLLGDSILGMPNFVGPLIPLALQFPHLRGTILAAAAMHLSNKVPGHPDYRIAKHYQQVLALRNYQTALNTPFTVHGQLGVDVLLVTALFVNMLSFCMPVEEGDDFNYAERQHSRQAGDPAPPCPDADPDPRRSWVFSTTESRLNWLAVQLGLAPLLVAAAPWREHSRLRLLYANSDDERRTLSGTWQSLSRVPRHWLAVFGLNPKARPVPGFRGSGVTTPAPAPAPSTTTTTTTTATTPPGSSPSTTTGGSPDSTGSSSTGATDMGSEADRVYRVPLRVVAELRVIEPRERNMVQYFQFTNQLSNDFLHKLMERDEKALWLFGMWMGLLCRFPDVWWTRRRSRCDFRAIRLWLHLVGVDQRPGEEGALWRRLLQDLDDTWGYEFATDPIMQRALSAKYR